MVTSWLLFSAGSFLSFSDVIFTKILEWSVLQSHQHEMTGSPFPLKAYTHTSVCTHKVLHGFVSIAIIKRGIVCAESIAFFCLGKANLSGAMVMAWMAQNEKHVFETGMRVHCPQNISIKIKTLLKWTTFKWLAGLFIGINKLQLLWITDSQLED